jgi:hypothetical protein
MDTRKLSIDNYKNILPGNLVKRSEKCIARECDEIEKYKYQAYVDKNDVSFDVTILLNDKKELLHHDCDFVHDRVNKISNLRLRKSSNRYNAMQKSY